MDAAGFCNGSGPTYTPDHAALAYKSFKKVPNGPDFPIYADEYDPVGTPSVTQPAVVVVHGGGWSIGCRWNMSGVAWNLSHDPSHTFNQHFTAFTIDYRLACDTNDTNIHVTSPLAPLCGWYYPTIDLGTGTRGAAIHDILDAVKWVRTVWGPAHPTTWNGTVALIGGSAGGNLGGMAAAQSSTGNSNRPDVLATLSGVLELSVMSNSTYGCDSPNTNDTTLCWRGKATQGIWESGVNRYLQCQVVNDQHDQACVDNGNYVSASPISSYNATSLPPAFFANGGFGGVGPELVASLEADDFSAHLQAIGFPSNQYLECKVDTTGHGTDLLGLKCEGHSETVSNSMVNFIFPFVCNSDHSCHG